MMVMENYEEKDMIKDERFVTVGIDDTTHFMKITLKLITITTVNQTPLH